MSRERWDVAVVGGGPAGAITARGAAEAGAKAVVFERAPIAPARCAGIVGLGALERLAPPSEVLLRSIREVRIHAPGGQCVELQASAAKAHVLDRTLLDAWLRERAVSAGVAFRFESVLGMKGTQLRTPSGTLTAGVVVGADGPVSGVARWSGMARPSELLPAVQAVVRTPHSGDAVEVFLGQDVAPGFFGWAVPAADGELRVGLATVASQAIDPLLDRLLASRYPRAEVVSRIRGLIPIGPPQRTAGQGVLLVGDAAGQVKPASGGGLYYIAICAELAGRIAAQGPEVALGYEHAWRAEVGQEIGFGLRARRYLLGLGDAALDEILGNLAGTELVRFLAEHGDIDHPLQTARALGRRPELWGALASTVLALLGMPKAGMARRGRSAERAA